MLNMHGHGYYVWSAYAIVIALLIAQWWQPWRRWKLYLDKIKNHEQDT